MERREFPNRSMPRWQIIAILFAALVSFAAVSKLVWDSQRWEISPSVARNLVDSREPVDQRAAIIAMHRDSQRSIEAMQRIADGAGEAAEQARIALRHIHEASRR